MYENNMKITKVDNTKDIIDVIKNRLDSKQIRFLEVSEEMCELLKNEFREDIIFTNSKGLGITTYIRGVRIFTNPFVTSSVTINYKNKNMTEFVYVYNNNNYSTRGLRSKTSIIDNWNFSKEHENMFDENNQKGNWYDEIFSRT